MPKETGNPLNLQRLAGELYYKPTGTAAYYNLGDVIMFKETPENETVDAKFHTRAASERIVRRDTKSTTIKFDVEGQERTPWVEALLMFGTPGADAVQAAIASPASVTLEDVALDVAYDLGKLNLTAVTVTVSAASKIVGTRVDGEVVPANADVILDAKLGMITIRSAGTIAALADVVVGYTASATTTQTIKEIGQHTQNLGAFRLVAFDGESEPFKKLIEFDGQLIPKDRGEHKTEDYNKFSFEVLATGDVSMRYIA
jgi:hypothetical protein